MTMPSTASKCVDRKLDGAISVLSQGTCRALSVGETAGARGGRGVLAGAFAVLDALAHAHAGLGLTDLARASGRGQNIGPSARRTARRPRRGATRGSALLHRGTDGTLSETPVC